MLFNRSFFKLPCFVLSSFPMLAAANGTPVPEFYCPNSYEYSDVHGQCVSDTSLHADFPQDARSLCEERGGGLACFKNNEWSKGFALWIRGEGPCFPGSEYNTTSGYCEDAEKVYGPFLNSDVNSCKGQYSLEVCEKVSWERSVLKSEKPIEFKEMKGKVWGLHEVTDEPLPEDGSAITPEQLSLFIKNAKKQGCVFVDYETFLSKPEKNQVLLTFDDGYPGNYNHAAPILEENEVPTIFFIHPFFIGRDIAPYGYLNWDQVAELSNNPLFTIGSHSYTHRDLRELGEVELRNDFISSQDTIKQKTGMKPTLLAYPMGLNDKKVRKIAGEVYQFSFSYGTIQYNSTTDRTGLRRFPLYAKNIERARACR